MREIIARKIATEDPSITAAEFSLLDVKELDLMAPAMTDVAIKKFELQLLTKPSITSMALEDWWCYSGFDFRKTLGSEMSTMMLHRWVVVVVQTLALDYLMLRKLVLADFQSAVGDEVRMDRRRVLPR